MVLLISCILFSNIFSYSTLISTYCTCSFLLSFIHTFFLSLFLSPSPSPYRQCYGEGLQWAGCVIMTLLAQEKRFASLDFSYHLLRIHEFDGQDGIVQGYVSDRE